MGSSFRKSAAVMKNQFYKMQKDSRMWLTCALIVAILIQYLSPFISYGQTNGTKMTPFLLSVIYRDGNISNGLLKVLIYLGVIALFCDAPFVTEQTPYELVRCQKKVWHRGKLMYIWIVSFLYPLFLSVVSFLITLPTITLTDFWGDTMRDFSQGPGIGMMGPPGNVIQMIYPWSAHLLTFGISALSNVFIGYLIYFVNLFASGSGAGVAAAVFVVMIDPVVRYWGIGSQRWMYRLSPVSWSSIEHWTIVGSNLPLSMEYAFGGYAVLILILGCLIGRLKKIER